MSKRIIYDKAYAGDESLVGKLSKPLPDMVADRLIAEGIGHLAGSAEDAKKKAKIEQEKSIKRNAEKVERQMEYARNGDPKPETKKERKAREKVERAAKAKATKPE